MYWFLYGLGIRLYFGLIGLIGLFNAKARKFIAGRNLSWPQPSNKKRIWFHVSSLGEFEQARPVIEALRINHNLDITLTFFSPSGYEVRKSYDQVDRVLYMPKDTYQKAFSFLEHYNFDLIVFVKYDFWMNHLRVAIDKQIPILFISVIFRADQFYFRLGKSFYLPLFRKITHFFVQNEASRIVLNQYQIEAVTLAGDTRIDRVRSIAQKTQSIDVIEQLLKDDRKVFVIGSAWSSDLEILDGLFRKHKHTFIFVIAPHDISPVSIHKITSGLTNVQLLSEYQQNQPCDFLVIDNIGMLASLYAYADFTYVGGAIRGALHNTLEAVAHGKPVFFGKHVNNNKFQEARGLVKAGAGFECIDFAALDAELQKLLLTSTHYEQACMAAKTYVEKNSGATKIIVDYMTKQLE